MTSARQLSLAAVATLLLASCASCASSASSATSPDGGAAADGIRMAEELGAPVAVPTELPAGYELLGSVGVNHRHGRALASAWLYSTDGAGPPVHLCVVARRVEPDVCPVEVRQWHVRRTTERYLVIVTTADREDRSIGAWERAEFTEDWESTGWIGSTDA